MLVLQFGGPSARGYMSLRQLRENQDKSVEAGEGEFEKGKFHPTDGSESRDGSEALWERHNGRRIEYPAPLHHSPIICKPDKFPWTSQMHAGSISTRDVFRMDFGAFSGNGTRAELLKIEKGGKLEIAGEDATQLFFATKGRGDVLGKGTWEQESALMLKPGESTVLGSDGSIGVLHSVLPSVRSARS